MYCLPCDGNTVIAGDAVEFVGDAAGFLDLARHQLAEVFQVDVARDELSKAVADGDDGRPKSPSFMPVARHRPRAPAMLRPWVVVRER